jgi:hypothetical protein
LAEQVPQKLAKTDFEQEVTEVTKKREVVQKYDQVGLSSKNARGLANRNTSSEIFAISLFRNLSLRPPV